MSQLRPLPTPWNVYNLRGSPFFQETLEQAHGAPHPLELFVGRERELAAMQAVIRSAGSSRQAVAGASGVGKTTLVQSVKAAALADGYLATDGLVPFLPDDTPERLFGRVLGALYDTILANRPQSIGNPAMQAAQQLVRADRLYGGGANVSIMGVGAGASRSVTVFSPKDLLIDGPRVVRDLLALVRESDARGVVLHLNNLENLSEAESADAAEILRSLRDSMLLHDGLHYIVVGTTDAVVSVVNTYPQIRSVFSTPLLLEPMPVRDMHALLAARYDHERLDPARPVVPPVDPDAVEELYGLFRGDLRGLLKALDDGTVLLIGLEGVPPEGDADRRVAPLTLSALRPVLARRYSAMLAHDLDERRAEQLAAWGRDDPASIQTQKSLAALWKIKQASISIALAALERQGYVVALPRAGTQPIQYVLSGVSRLVFG